MGLKGVFFSMDALFASVLIGIAVILLSQFFIVDNSAPQIDFLSRDLVNSLSNIKIYQLDDPYVKMLIQKGNISNLNNTVIEQIGEFYVLNQSELAYNLSRIVSQRLIPPRFGFEILVNDESIIRNESNWNRLDDLASFKRMVSGLEKFKPLKGSTSKVFLEGINRKTYASYLYYGGFIGQGNITTFIDDIPSGASLTDLYMELDAGGRFILYINDAQCNTTFYPGSGTMTADNWNISACLSSVVPGARNNFTIEFIDELGSGYLGGGYVKVTYDTDEMFHSNGNGVMTEWLPGVAGIINIYSSFYVPGTIDSMAVYIHYWANDTNSTNNTMYLTIGNHTVLRISNLSGEGNFSLTDSNLTPYLSYSELGEETIPIRMGFENVSFGYIYEGNADVALITDVSGSMNWRMSSDDSGTARNCDWPSYDDPTTTRLSVAKCLDKQFSRNIINITGNLVGLISYDTATNTDETVAPTIDLDTLDSIIGNASLETGYSVGLWTCVCCGINSARDILMANISAQTVIDYQSTWRYNDNYLFTVPPDDAQGDEWYEVNYDDSSWSSDDTILGATNSYIYTPLVNNEISSDLPTDQTLYANLWERGDDTDGPPNDFSSGILNTTGDTFGIAGDDDGWDNASGVFDYTGPVQFDQIVDYRLQIHSRDDIDDVSGAYGIEINITPEMYALISSNEGTAVLSFNWWWDDQGGFESSDQMWIKGTWNSSYSGIHYLGSDLDSSHSPSDPTYEIFSDEDPDHDQNNQAFSQSVLSWIEGPGMYYLALGGKLKRDDINEDGRWQFDNIQLEISGFPPGVLYANLWEHVDDNKGPPNDFTNGVLNDSGTNTFGIAGANDGWDYASGVYDYTNSVTFDEIVSGRLQIYSQYNYNDVSGAYGVGVEITSEMYEILSQENGKAILSFDWWWDPVDYFWTIDEMWVKATWNSSTSGVHYLGSSMDEGHTPSDATYEIYADEYPYADSGQNTFTQFIEDWIEGPGNYYLTLGGKLERSNYARGYWYFDNIQLEITNLSNHYYFRKNFTINDMSQVGMGILSVLSDDNAVVYLNGQIVNSDVDRHDAEYWNVRGETIDRDYFVQGTNVIAASLSNSERAAKFDLKLRILNSSRSKAMMVMTDGQANIECGEQGVTTDMDGDGDSDDGCDDAVQAACDAREDYGITVYAVGYSDSADEMSLQGIALCGGGLFTKSDNVTALQRFYQQVASSIVSASRHSQTIEVEGDLTASILYPDSYIEVNYTPSVTPPSFGEIALVVEEKNFDNCTFNVTIPPDIRIMNSRLTSYSSEHWTDALLVNGNEIYNLSHYSYDYTALGDPFIVHIPPTYLQNGENTFFVRTGDSPENMTSCSLDNTFIYDAMLTSSVSYSDVLEFADGCSWFIEFDNGGNTTVLVPPDYSGAKNCEYSSSDFEYNANDTYDDAMFRLLDQLDLDDNGQIYVDLDEQDFVIGAISVGLIPYPWGPAIAEVRVWK